MLNREVLATMCAISNMGQPLPKINEVKRLLNTRDISISSSVLFFASQYIETDKDQEIFEQEAEMWLNKLKDKSIEQLQKDKLFSPMITTLKLASLS